MTIDNKTLQRAVCLGWNIETIKKSLHNSNIEKVIIFSNDEKNRPIYESLYSFFKNKITLYEGDILNNFNAYLKLRHDEGITPEQHYIVYIHPGLF